MAATETTVAVCVPAADSSEAVAVVSVRLITQLDVFRDAATPVRYVICDVADDELNVIDEVDCGEKYLRVCVETDEISVAVAVPTS